nr:hypothetical protein [Candidatus Woesearchaeota archaeon]
MDKKSKNNRKINIWALITLIIFSLITLLSFLIDALPFAVISLLFVFFSLIVLIYDKKISDFTALALYMFWAILVYAVIQYLALNVVENAWYANLLLNTSKLLDANLFMLIVVTLYALFTYMMFAEMRKSRIVSQIPNIIARPEQEGDWSMVYLIIRNIGGSPAFDVKGYYTVTNNNNGKKDYYWHHSVMQSMEKVKLVLGTEWLHNFYKQNKKLEVKFEYKDKEGNLFTENLNFNLKELLEGINKTVWALDKDREYEISKSMKDIAKDMKSISENLKYVAYEPKKKYNKEESARIKKFIASRKKSDLNKLKKDIENEIKSKNGLVRGKKKKNLG